MTKYGVSDFVFLAALLLIMITYLQIGDYWLGFIGGAIMVIVLISAATDG